MDLGTIQVKVTLPDPVSGEIVGSVGFGWHDAVLSRTIIADWYSAVSLVIRAACRAASGLSLCVRALAFLEVAPCVLTIGATSSIPGPLVQYDEPLPEERDGWTLGRTLEITAASRPATSSR